MYELNTNQARTDLFKKGLGGAHSWDFDTLDKAVQLNSQRRQQEQQLKQKQDVDRMDDINKQVSQLGDQVFSRDLPKFLEKQVGIKDYVVKNIKALKNGDVQAQAQLNAMVNEFHATAKASNEVGKNWLATKKFVEEKGRDNYYPDTLDKLEKFGNPESAMNFDANSFQPEEMHDIDKDIDTQLLPELLHTKKGVESSSPDYKSGEQQTSRKFLNTSEEAKQQLMQKAASDPSWLRRGHYDLSQETPEIQMAYGDNIPAYIADKKAHKITFNQSEFKRTPLSENANGPVEIEIATSEKPITYNITTQDVNGGTTKATVSVLARASATKPIKVIGASSVGVRTVDGNQPLDNTEVNEMEFGHADVVPVYKKGVKNPKGESMAGNVVPDQMLEQEKKKGGVEYKSMAYGTAKIQSGTDEISGKPIYKDVSIVKPADEIKAALEKDKIPLNELNNYANEMNAKLHGNDKQIGTKEINGVMRKVYQRADGSKYAK